ncbi:hypothetical protein [Pseudomonas phage K4]|nr:hypothetical protein [Pseudomonas phage K4]
MPAGLTLAESCPRTYRVIPYSVRRLENKVVGSVGCHSSPFDLACQPLLDAGRSQTLGLVNHDVSVTVNWLFIQVVNVYRNVPVCVA